MADAPSPDLFAGHAPVTVLAICPRMVTSVNLPANRMRSSPLPHELCHVPSVSSCRSRCLLARGRIVGRGPVRVNRRLDSLALGNEEAFREARCGHSGTSPHRPSLAIRDRASLRGSWHSHPQPACHLCQTDRNPDGRRQTRVRRADVYARAHARDWGQGTVVMREPIGPVPFPRWTRTVAAHHTI